MGATVDSYRSDKLFKSGCLLQEVCGGFLQDGESTDLTHQEGPTFLLDK